MSLWARIGIHANLPWSLSCHPRVEKREVATWLSALHNQPPCRRNNRIHVPWRSCKVWIRFPLSHLPHGPRNNPPCREETPQEEGLTNEFPRWWTHVHRRLPTRARALRMHAPGNSKRKKGISTWLPNWKTVILVLAGAASVWIALETYGA